MLALAALLLTQTPEYPQQSVSVGDHRIAYHTMGTQGPPIVAIPGGPGFAGRSLWSFGYEMQDVARVYLFDQLGTGGSRMKDLAADPTPRLTLDQTIEDLEAVRRKLGHEKWTVFGQSWGVLVALKYAATYPDRVDRLVLASVPGMGHWEQRVLSTNLESKTPESVKNEILAAAQNPALSDDEKTEQAVYLLLPYYFHDPKEGHQLASLAPPNLFSAKVYGTMYRFVNDPALLQPLADHLKSWPGQAIILQGHQDVTGGAMGYRLRDSHLPRATVHMFDEAGHFSWMERSTTDGFFFTLRDWLSLPQHPEFQSEEGLALLRSLDKRAEKRFADHWPFGYKPSK